MFQVPQIIFAAAVPPNPINVAIDIDPMLITYYDVEVTIIRVINMALGFMGILAVIMVILGGFWYLTAAGNEDQAKKGAKYILYALIGIIIVSSSYAISYTLLSAPSADWNADDISESSNAIEWMAENNPF